MINPKIFTATVVSKSVLLLGKVLGKSTSAKPGELARRVYPNILSHQANQVKGDIIAVCGTNGKTTTNNLLCAMLEESGKRVICNRYGANMPTGIITSFLKEASLSGKFNADRACLEVDEAYARHIFGDLSPSIIVITNIFRDQLDRYGETETTAQLLLDAVNKTENATLVLNADDPLLVYIGKKSGKKCVFFGVGEDASLHVDETRESGLCPECGAELSYSFRHFSGLGNFRCEKCGFSRPKPQFEALNVSLKNGLEFTVNGMPFSINYRGFYNIYNILAAFAASSLSGAQYKGAISALKKYRPENGRMQVFNIGGKEIILNLAKNPAGFNQCVSAVMSDARPKDVLAAVNDTPSDGTDISWLWDVDFDKFSGDDVQTVITSGTRADDVLLRFKYGNLPLNSLSSKTNLKDAVTAVLAGKQKLVYILANYTSMFEIKDILTKLQKEGK